MSNSFNLTVPVKVVNANANIDSDYGPYPSAADANIAIPENLRKPGKTVGILTGDTMVEWWWDGGITNNHLVIKSSNIVVDLVPTNGSANAVSSDGVFDALALKEDKTNKGIANGYVPLNSSIKIDAEYLPSYVDDIIESPNYNTLIIAPGVGGVVYVTLDDNKLYRWGGSSYVSVSSTEAVVWGGITGTLANQTDLQQALNDKQNVLLIAPNVGLVITGNTLSTIYNTTIADNVNSIALGGAPATPAAVWKTRTLVEVIDTLIFPTILAFISANQSANLVLSGASGNYEIGTLLVGTLTANFYRGAITNGNGAGGPNLVGAAAGSAYTFNGTSIGTPPVQSGNTFALSQAIVAGVNSWAVNIAFQAGSGSYYDNKGNAGSNLDTSRNSGSIAAGNSPAVAGYYKQFYGITTIPILNSSNVRSLANSNFAYTNSFPIYINEVNYIIAIPATKSLVSIVTSNFETILANSPYITMSIFNVNDAGNNPISYKIYKLTTGTPLNLNATVTLS